MAPEYYMLNGNHLLGFNYELTFADAVRGALCNVRNSLCRREAVGIKASKL